MQLLENIVLVGISTFLVYFSFMPFYALKYRVIKGLYYIIKHLHSSGVKMNLSKVRWKTSLYISRLLFTAIEDLLQFHYYSLYFEIKDVQSLMWTNALYESTAF